MTDSAAPPILARAGGLFSERQITRPLVVAILITVPSYLTLFRLLDPAILPQELGRYLGNGYCQLMIAVFFTTLLYGLLQYLGLLDEQRHLQRWLGLGAGPQSTRLHGWIGFLSGRRHQDADGVPAALQRWYGKTQAREDFVHLSDYVLTVRGLQHQHNFAPIGFAIWVLPLLGFIGTVIGITQAIGGLEQSVGTSEIAGDGLGSVLGGLSFAFDTTFVGLVLVIPVMLLLLTLRTRAQKLDMVYYQMLLDRLFHETAD